MYVFRLHTRPRGGSASMKDTFQYCLDHKIMGVGWQLNSNKTSATWEEYLSEAETIHGDLKVCKYIKKWVSPGDLVWTRDTEGNYYLAKVQSGWEYFVTPESIEKDIDIANIFRVDFLPVKIDAVPGKIVACFRPARTFQKIASPSAIEYTKYLWNSISGTNEYAANLATASDIFEMLDDEETEDLVFMYLQSKGWYIVPNSRKKDTMGYEFLAINPKTGERAITQVKTGAASLNPDSYATQKEKVFLFQSQERYLGSPQFNVSCLRRQELSEFMEHSQSWLPETIQRKMNICKSLQTG